MTTTRRTLAHLICVALLCMAAACADEQASSPASDESNLNEPPATYEPFPLPIGSDGGPLRSTLPELDQRSFVLQSVDGDATLSGVAVTLSFVRDELRFRGACNGSNAKYGLEAGLLRLGRVGTTGKNCGAETLTTDDWLRTFMTSSPSLELASHTLTLRNGDATLVFVEGATAQADAGR